MLELAEIMHFYASQLGETNLARDFRRKANCYAAKMHERLFNENTGLYADYVGMQWKPVAVKGRLVEPVTWRDDLACGSLHASPLD